MDFPMRVRGMIQNALGEATEEEVMTECVYLPISPSISQYLPLYLPEQVMTEAAATAAQSAIEKPTASVQSAALDRKWVNCWSKMLFKDMVG